MFDFAHLMNELFPVNVPRVHSINTSGHKFGLTYV